uniref:Protein FAM162B n=2 Tax=Callorhinchus milii TaxID=7868 RepID=V9LEL8_CALMI|eukprot:gi/632986129/ref/XP_007910063.1/ PREDICTED: protein FAM162B-like [Callorhinchus milii]
MWSRVSAAAQRRLPGPGATWGLGRGEGSSRAPGAGGRRRCLSGRTQGSSLVPEPGRPARPEPEGGERPAYKLPGFTPSNMDKRLLLWAGRFKREEDIPAVVSFEMIDAARNKMRVKACYAMVLLTVLACIGTVIAGKKAAGRQESLTAMNMEKRARWKEEAQRELEASKNQ